MYCIDGPEGVMVAPSPMLAATPLLTAVCNHLPRAAEALLHLGATPITEAQCQLYGASGLPDWYVTIMRRVAEVRERTPSQEDTLVLGPAVTHPSLWPWTTGFKQAVKRVSEARGGGGSSDWGWAVTHPRLWP